MTGSHLYTSDVIIFQIAIPHFLLNSHLYILIQLLGEVDASASTISRRNYSDDRLWQMIIALGSQGIMPLCFLILV